MAKKIIIGNWKMHKTAKESVKDAHELKKLVKDVEDVDIVLCPTFTALPLVEKELEESDVKLGAQNMHYEDEGAYTGEVGAKMVKEFAKYVILGHHERRQYFNEDNETVNKKVKSALQHNLIPIICVGESLEDREGKNTKKVLEHQLTTIFKGISKEEAAKCIVAYEPVWAVGTGKVANLAQIDEAHSFIKHLLIELYNEETEKKIRICYGGSITEENVTGIITAEHVDGILIGNASLEPKEFSAIIHYKKE